MLFYPVRSLKTYMIDDPMERMRIKHHPVLVEKRNIGSLCSTNVKHDHFFVSKDLQMSALFYIHPALSGKNKEGKVIIDTFGNTLQHVLQEDVIRIIPEFSVFVRQDINRGLKIKLQIKKPAKSDNYNMFISKVRAGDGIIGGTILAWTKKSRYSDQCKITTTPASFINSGELCRGKRERVCVQSWFT